MGTTYSLRIPRLPTDLDATALKHDIDGLLEVVNDQMSTYRPMSELSRFNTSGAQTWTPVSPDVATVVRVALATSKLSGGAYDPTIGPLVMLWGFGAGSRPEAVPDRGRLMSSLRGIGHEYLAVQTGAPALRKARDDLNVDLSGIAKGFGADKVAARLERVGIESYLFELGGEVRVRGYGRRGDFWRIGIEEPGGAGVRRVIRLASGAVATSGDYRHFFKHRGRRYSHILDPRDGQPVSHGLASVTVVAPTAMEADALSTALMVLGLEQGLNVARQRDIAAYFLARTGGRLREAASPAFLPYVRG
ncbi:MAG: FAD:protein FMN transferase [Alphaproteobacteria bacterium]|nr:FAD:protein FMN transferase [Alphaproteobacteria bacterium]